VFEQRVLRRIFGPKRDEIMWEWRIEKLEMGGACGMYGGGESYVQGSGGEN
jgi:hypothetical protein